MKRELPAQVLAQIRQQRLLAPGERLVVGVSGGPDSTALLHLLIGLRPQLPLTLGVAHFNHGLRGAAAAADAEFVAGLAASYKLPFHLGRGDVAAAARKTKTSIQAAARRLRLEFFQRLRREAGYDKIALGHTADDQLELFFLRLLRGAGPEGLRGMVPLSPLGIIRPLLSFQKSEILAWLAANNFPYRLDASNFSRRYRRNRLRLEILPLLRRLNPNLGRTIARLQAILGQWEDFLSEAAAVWGPELPVPAPGAACTLPLAPLEEAQPVLRQRLLRLWLAAAGVPIARLTYRHYQALERLCTHQRGQVLLPGSWRLASQQGSLILSRDQEPPPPLPLPLLSLPATEAGRQVVGQLVFVWQTLNRSELPASPPADPWQAWLDRDRLNLPLVVRSWQAGDRFQPLGLPHRKKLQDFFVDAKIPRSQRGRIPLLVSGADIIWVVGYRLADPVKITPATRRILRFQVTHAGPIS